MAVEALRKIWVVCNNPPVIKDMTTDGDSAAIIPSSIYRVALMNLSWINESHQKKIQILGRFLELYTLYICFSLGIETRISRITLLVQFFSHLQKFKLAKNFILANLRRFMLTKCKNFVNVLAKVSIPKVVSGCQPIFVYQF